jgi:hypothetical protein
LAHGLRHHDSGASTKFDTLLLVIMKSQKNVLRVYKGPPTKCITVLVPNNPKTPGKLCHRRFGLYRPGMTVAEYYLACEQIGEKSRRYKLDIEWDLDRRFIRLD